MNKEKEKKIETIHDFTEQKLKTFMNKPEKLRDELTKIGIFNQIVKQSLKENIDYGVIKDFNGKPIFGNKPCLFKTGAHKLCIILGFNSEVKTELVIKKILNSQGIEQSMALVTAIVTLVDKNNIKVGTGIGACSSFERAKRTLSIGDFFNIGYKIAKKRALVDAIIGYAGLTEIFTQDIDEMSKNIEKKITINEVILNFLRKTGSSLNKKTFINFIKEYFNNLNKDPKKLSQNELKEMMDINWKGWKDIINE